MVCVACTQAFSYCSIASTVGNVVTHDLYERFGHTIALGRLRTRLDAKALAESPRELRGTPGSAGIEPWRMEVNTSPWSSRMDPGFIRQLENHSHYISPF